VRIKKSRPGFPGRPIDNAIDNRQSTIDNAIVNRQSAVCN
jgi:hypothetical protein